MFRKTSYVKLPDALNHSFRYKLCKTLIIISKTGEIDEY